MSILEGISFNENSKKLMQNGQKIMGEIYHFSKDNLLDSRDLHKFWDELTTAAMWYSRAVKADQQLRDDMAANPLKYQIREERKKKSQEAMEKAVRAKSEPARRRVASHAVIIERKVKQV
jgi:hypothetical protein